MSHKELIGKLTPAHFTHGESFDKEAFASLIDALLKSQSNAWKMPVIWIAGMLLAAMFASIGGFIGYSIAIICIFAGIIGGNLSLMGLAKQINAAKKELGITQDDINAAIRLIKAESQQQGLVGTMTSAKAVQKPAPTSTKAAKTLFIIFSVLVLLIHALMLFAFIINVIDGDPEIGRYSIFAIGSVLAIFGVILMMKKQLWAYVLVLTGIVLFSVGMGDEFREAAAVTIFFLMTASSVMMLFAEIWLRRKEQQAITEGVPKPFRLTWKYLLLMAGAAVAVILAIILGTNVKYNNTYWAYDMYKAQLRKTGKWGFLDQTKQQEVVPCIYDEADRTYNILKVKLNGKWGMFNKNGNEIIPCRYDFIGNELNDSLLYVRENNKHGLVHFDGREVVTCIYDKPLLHNSSSELLKAVLEGKCGFIDRSGNTIIPIQYDNADFIAGRGIWADLKGEKSYFDLQGNKVDYDPATVTQKQAKRSNGKMMKVEYNSQKETFTFTDVETGELLKYNRIKLDNVEPVGIRYYFSQQGGSMIQFVMKAKKVLGTSQEKGQIVTRYSGESTISFPLYRELPYTLEEGILTIER